MFQFSLFTISFTDKTFATIVRITLSCSVSMLWTMVPSDRETFAWPTVWSFVCLCLNFGQDFLCSSCDLINWSPHVVFRNMAHRSLYLYPTAFYLHLYFQFDVNLAVCHLLSQEMNYYLGQPFLQCFIHFDCLGFCSDTSR